MDEISRYVVGLDVGTSNVRAVMANVAGDGSLNVIGFSEVPSAGMRLGTMVDLVAPQSAINRALSEIEKMSGIDVKSAAVSINGEIITTRVDGMIALAGLEHEINHDDLARVEDLAKQGRLPANNEELILAPLAYKLDDHGGIKTPLGMMGARLEMVANVITTSKQSVATTRQVLESVNLTPEMLMPTAVAAARAVTTQEQCENGVAVMDMGAETTGIAVFEEGDLQYVGVIPMGSKNLTKDLAKWLGINMAQAEDLKQRFASAQEVPREGEVVMKWEGQEMRFQREVIDEIVRGHLDKLLAEVAKELKRAHYLRRLPEGIVLVGGGVRMRGIEKYIHDALNTAVVIGVPSGLVGVGTEVCKPEYAAAVGLAIMMSEAPAAEDGRTRRGLKKPKSGKSGAGFLKRFFSKF